MTNETYKNTGKGLSRYDLQSQLPSLKKEYECLGDSYSQCLQVVCLNLSRGFINFFEKRSPFSRFKSKHGKQSLSYPQNVKIGEDNLKFPKLGEIYAKIHRPIDGKVKTVTITKNKTNQYYASILFEDGKEQPQPSTEGKAIGLDKTCSHCLNIVDSFPLDIRHWTCDGCATLHYRDLNASINIRDKGLRIISSGTGDKAYCPDVKRSKGGRKKSTTTLSVG